MQNGTRRAAEGALVVRPEPTVAVEPAINALEVAVASPATACEPLDPCTSVAGKYAKEAKSASGRDVSLVFSRDR